MNEWGHGFIVEDKLKLIIFFETFAFYNWKIIKKIKKENRKEHKTCISDFAKSLTAIVNSSKYLLIPYHSIVDKAHYSGCQVLFYLWWIKHVLKFEKFRNNTTRIVVMEKSKGNCVIIGSWTDMYWIEFHHSGNHYIIYKISALTLLNLIFRKWHFLKWP